MGEKKGDSEIAKSAEIMGFTIEIDQKSVYFEKKLCSLFSLICDSKIRFQTPYLEKLGFVLVVTHFFKLTKSYPGRVWE